MLRCPDALVRMSKSCEVSDELPSNCRVVHHLAAPKITCSLTRTDGVSGVWRPSMPGGVSESSRSQFRLTVRERSGLDV